MPRSIYTGPTVPTVPTEPSPPRPPSPTFPGDGRHIDPDLGGGGGEGAAIDVRDPELGWPLAGAPAVVPDRAAMDTYYDLPVIKPAPWRWYVPAYFAAGGLAGAAASLAGAAELTGAHPALGARLRWIAALGDAAGATLLIADLGRPERFHHMLRVFRPTSPMNLGTWILSSAGATSAAALWTTRRGRRAPVAISLASLVTGTLLSTYTGVLIGNTAVPIWAATRRCLPLWFAALSAASLGAVLEIVAPGAPVTRAYSAIGKAAQLVTASSVARAARRGDVDAPLRTGRSGALWRGATWLGVASLLATLWPAGSRPRSWLAGALGTAAALLGRFAIAEAGRASAADPRATFVPQRRAAATSSRLSGSATGA
jgi:formate-dependent nitrite reductase membrane component NrfD